MFNVSAIKWHRAAVWTVDGRPSSRPESVRWLGSRALAGASRLEVPQYGVGDVWLFEAFDLVVGQIELLGGDGIGEMAELGSPDDRRRHALLLQEPRQRDLRGRDTTLRRYFGDAFHDIEVGWLVVEVVNERISLGPSRAPLPVTSAVAGEHAPGKRTPRN